MNVHFSYKAHKTPDIEKEINHQIDKVQKRLQVFRPDLIHLKGVIEEGAPREGIRVALNLRLPSGQLAAQAKASSSTSAIKTAFDELIQQISRHKDLLRSRHKWRHWRGGGSDSPELGVPFEETIAAVTLPAISADDISSYVNANLPRLTRFVERELSFRRVDEQIPPGNLAATEVVNEVIVRALSDIDRPEKLALEPWLYRLALLSMTEMTARLREAATSTHIEESGRRQNLEASDEAWTKESSIADRRVNTPEQELYSDEVIALVHAALANASRADREVFLLHGIEGFTLEEIAAITGRHVEAVNESMQRARTCIRSAPSIAQEFRSKGLLKTRPKTA